MINIGMISNAVRIKLLFIIAGLALGCDSGRSSRVDETKEQEMFSSKKSEKYVVFSPMEGVLKKDGQALSNTRLIRKLSWNGNEGGLEEEFFTDGQGRFSLPVHEVELSLGMLEQFVGKADIEYELNGARDYLWTSSKFHPEIYSETNGPISSLVCDISYDELAVPMGPTSILTKCRWKDMPE